jgi:hypothetical protein
VVLVVGMVLASGLALLVGAHRPREWLHLAYGLLAYGLIPVADNAAAGLGRGHGARKFAVTHRRSSPRCASCPCVVVSYGPTRYGRIISLSSCSTMWQCQTYRPAWSKSALTLVISPG